jgi:hypothetical protein
MVSFPVCPGFSPFWVFHLSIKYLAWTSGLSSSHVGAHSHTSSDTRVLKFGAIDWLSFLLH